MLSDDGEHIDMLGDDGEHIDMLGDDGEHIDMLGDDGEHIDMLGDDGEHIDMQDERLCFLCILCAAFFTQPGKRNMTICLFRYKFTLGKVHFATHGWQYCLHHTVF